MAWAPFFHFRGNGFDVAARAAAAVGKADDLDGFVFGVCGKGPGPAHAGPGNIFRRRNSDSGRK